MGGDILNNREAAAELRELIEVQGGHVQTAVRIRPAFSRPAFSPLHFRSLSFCLKTSLL